MTLYREYNQYLPKRYVIVPHVYNTYATLNVKSTIWKPQVKQEK